MRQSKWYTQLKVSLDLYLTQNCISRYETGECGADYELLVRFADYYNLLINFILCYTDNLKLNQWVCSLL